MTATVRNILVCPLGWGLGHTTRMIPLIRKIMTMNCRVIFGGDRWQIDLIRKEIPEIQCINFRGFSIKYSGFLPQYIVILIFSPLFWYHSLREHFQLKKLIKEHNIDIVISDSRIGLWNRCVKSVLVTHLIRIPLPRLMGIFENLTVPLSRIVINRFTYCFIPDLPGEVNLSGRLSHRLCLPRNAKYIGILSRFHGKQEAKENIKGKYFCIAIMSGPSPQKEILTQKVIDILKEQKGNSIILTGNPSSASPGRQEGNIMIVNHLPQDEWLRVIRQSELIITRSGYTTIMELYSLRRSAILIPTPGQAEQEYLARYLSEKKWFSYIRQKHLGKKSLPVASANRLPGYSEEENDSLLSKALNELLEQ